MKIVNRLISEIKNRISLVRLWWENHQQGIKDYMLVVLHRVNTITTAILYMMIIAALTGSNRKK